MFRRTTRSQALQSKYEFDRARATRVGDDDGDVDSIFDDWFGQKGGSTSFGSDLSRARVVLEVEPECAERSSDLDQVFLTAGLPIERS